MVMGISHRTHQLSLWFQSLTNCVLAFSQFPQDNKHEKLVTVAVLVYHLRYQNYYSHEELTKTYKLQPAINLMTTVKV